MTKTPRFRILPYKVGSRSIEALYGELDFDFKLIRLENSKYNPRKEDIVINWGNSTTTQEFNCNILNKPSSVAFASNKLNFFRALSDYNIPEANRPRIPDWTTDKEEVRGWIRDGHKVFARNKLTGHSGEGIDVLETLAQVDSARATLFTKYTKKRHEFRVHFFDGNIFDVQRKAKVNDRDDVNYMIRSHANGFIYSRNNVGDVPEDVMTQVNKTVGILDLDFGAVDVIYNQLHDKAYVLEVNTAPGLEGTTLTNYVTQFTNKINSILSE